MIESPRADEIPFFQDAILALLLASGFSRNSAGVVLVSHALHRTDVLNTLSGASVNNSGPPLSRRYDNR